MSFISHAAFSHQEFANPLINAADQNQYSRVKQLLERGADPNMQGEFGVTAIMRAAYNNNTEIVDLLLQYGAKPEIGDIAGADAFRLAERSGKPESLQLLSSYSKLINTQPKETMVVKKEAQPKKPEKPAEPVRETIHLEAKKKTKEEDEKYITDLFDTFYADDSESASLQNNGGVYGFGRYAIAYKPTRVYHQPSKPQLKATEAVVIAEEDEIVEDNVKEVAIKTSKFLICGFKNQEDMKVKFNANIAKYYFNVKDFQQNDIDIRFENKWSHYKARKACGRYMRRYRGLVCEVY